VFETEMTNEATTVDEKERVEGPHTVGIYAHIASDGFAHCSYDARTTVIDELDCPSSMTTLEYIEGQFFGQEWADDLIESLTPEGERVDDPPKVGTLTYNNGEITDLTFKNKAQVEA
jgi:hypothetical protein